MAPDYEKYQLTVLQKEIHVRYLKLIELENLGAGSLYNAVVAHYQNTGIPLERLVMVTSVGNARPLKLIGGAIKGMKIKY